MTELNQIRINEGADMGRRIVLYRLAPGTERFTAFGYSAFRICRMVPGIGRAAYSSELEMPYLELTSEEARAIGGEDMADAVDICAYNGWAAQLPAEEGTYIPVPVLDSGFTIVDGMSPAGRAVKRLFDIVASAVALVSLSPLLIALGI